MTRPMVKGTTKNREIDPKTIEKLRRRVVITDAKLAVRLAKHLVEDGDEFVDADLPEEARVERQAEKADTDFRDYRRKLDQLRAEIKGLRQPKSKPQKKRKR